MKTYEINLYAIEELKNINIKAYDKIINDTKNELISDRFDFDALYDIQVIFKKHNLKVTNKDIYYSISYSQGDGACFVLKDILRYYSIKDKKELNAFEQWIIDNLNDEEMILLLKYLENGGSLDIIRQLHQYCHARTCYIDYWYINAKSDDEQETADQINNFISKLCDELFNNVYLKICYEIEAMLYSYYDMSDDDVVDFINDNGYMFDINGVYERL